MTYIARCELRISPMVLIIDNEKFHITVKFRKSPLGTHRHLKAGDIFFCILITKIEKNKFSRFLRLRKR